MVNIPSWNQQAEALQTNSSIHTINIWGNALTGKGAALLAEALTINVTVTSLDLRDNNVGPEVHS